MSALDFEEATHKLLKIDLGDGQEVRFSLTQLERCDADG